jgi:hypothetical protein
MKYQIVLQLQLAALTREFEKLRTRFLAKQVEPTVYPHSTPDDLGSYPTAHPYRNTPLYDLKAYYRAPTSKLWQEVTFAYTLAKQKNTYNDLNAMWQKNTWKATQLL